MTLRGVHHVAFTVADAGKSADWYRDVLGLKTVADFVEEDGNRRKVVMTSETLATRIGFVEHRSTEAGTFDERMAGLDHISFSIELDDLDDLVATLERHAVEHTPPVPSILRPEARVVVFRDPDNIQLELYAEPAEG